MAAKRKKRPGEFELIERYFRPLAGDAGAFALTDDAAVYRQRPGEDLVVTTDMIAGRRPLLRRRCAGLGRQEGAPRQPLRPRRQGRDALRLPARRWRLPADWTESWLAGFARGLKADQERYGITLIGGDTIRAAGGLTVSVTALGRIPKGRMVTRAGARPGDVDLRLRHHRRCGARPRPAPRADRRRRGQGGQAPHRPLPAPAAAHGAGAGPPPPCLERHGRLRRPRRRSRPHLRRLRRRRRDRGGAGAAVARGAAAACRRPAADRARSSPAATTTRSWRRSARSAAPRFAAAAREAGVPVTRIGRIVDGKGPPLRARRRRQADPPRRRRPCAFLACLARRRPAISNRHDDG